MSLPLTQIEGVPDSQAMKDGMAYFPDTGPLGTKCGECVHRGYYRPLPDRFNQSTGQWETRQRRVQACEMFKKLSGKHGPPVEPDWPSCKYFEERPKK